MSNFEKFPPFQQVNSLNKGTESRDILTVPMLEALDKNDEANTREPDHKFYISYDFYSKNNYEFHRKDLYGFHQGNEIFARCMIWHNSCLSNIKINESTICVISSFFF